MILVAAEPVELLALETPVLADGNITLKPCLGDPNAAVGEVGADLGAYGDIG